MHTPRPAETFCFLLKIYHLSTQVNFIYGDNYKFYSYSLQRAQRDGDHTIKLKYLVVHVQHTLYERLFENPKNTCFN